VSSPNLIYDPNAGGDVEANLNFEADGLTVFGPTGRKLHHWRYSEIVHAFPKRQGMNEVLIHPSRPELRLRVGHAATYDAIAERAPQLRRRAIITWQGVMALVPDEFHYVLFLALFGSSLAGLSLLVHLFE
jgi:hypothetical protein